MVTDAGCDDVARARFGPRGGGHGKERAANLKAAGDLKRLESEPYARRTRRIRARVELCRSNHWHFADASVRESAAEMAN
jgi:hypothetical protein